MKPAPFAYHDPESTAETVALLAEHGDDASVLAGGQSLIPLLNMRLAKPGVIVDLNRVGELDFIRGENGAIVIGAMTRQRVAESDALAREACPLLLEALGLVGHMPIRSRGTVGGSIAHADPAAELPTVLTALDGTVTSVGPSGERRYRAEEFFTGFLTTALGPGEVVKDVRFPLLPSGSGVCFTEVARRKGDFALVGVAAAVTLGEDGACTAAYLSLNGVGSTPFKAREAEEHLVGTRLDDPDLTAVASDVEKSVEPGSDLHASGNFRRHLARILTERALKQARDRAREESR